jgi:inhibitor of cysteine peptidase
MVGVSFEAMRLSKALALPFAALLFACPPASDPSTGGPPGGATLSEANSGATVNARQGDPITVVLDENPTSGYQWNAGQPPDPAVLRLERNDFGPPQGGTPGQGGKRVVGYRAVGPGRTNVVLEYRRSWEQGRPPARTFWVTIQVM